MNRISKLLVVAVLAVFLLSPLVDARKNHHNRDFKIHSLKRFDSPLHHNSNDDIEVELKKGSIIFTNYDEDSQVEITEEYDLYIDDKKIALDKHQQGLVEDFHKQSYEIVKFAKQIGIEGAKIGLGGAMIGLKAVSCVFKLLSPNYDSDDLEREVEKAAKKLEKKAERLERKAEEIEYMVEDLEDISIEMTNDIPELADLNWF